MFSKLMRVAIVALLLTEGTASAYEYGLQILDPRMVSIETWHNDKVRDPYIAPQDKSLSYGAAFNINMDVIRYYDLRLYMDNKLHLDQDGDTGKVAHAGWQYEVGTDLWKGRDGGAVQLFRYHHSRHVLDQTRTDQFPVVDTTGLRFILLSK